ncbi:endolytic transglycosylase MltG [Dellaglioa algida]|uniref:endolytic transglycosylase MltG n=1 Tax=Dellaglioa algida TaxID=105612 RepID=UPI0024C4762B|nr:endolytic transglycosylase MltG [Dellaglioa algida]MDK1727407.1 endolytic transglycosylase MltG [Dellaglioa algida]MDK1735467.1 endolytic transglycosylase MltG [Dellaglioa algida]MDK1736730.1 endolytic transglycosylase MltG [Dellaglioa algida]
MKNEDISPELPPENNKKQAKRIIVGVITLLCVLLLTILFMTYNYIKASLDPLDKNNNKIEQVYIPIGSNTKQIGTILEKNKIIKSGTVYTYYVKQKNVSQFKGGYYQLKASMSLDKIAWTLQQGGSSEPIQNTLTKVLVSEGTTVNEIGKAIAKKTNFSYDDFIKLMKNKTFLTYLDKKYPDLLNSSMASKNVRYHLEGYLFPATYTVYKKTTLKDLVEQMIVKANDELSPYYETISKQKLTVQNVISLSSLVEKETANHADRQKIAGVYFNRIDAEIPLQSNISVSYALNTPQRELTSADYYTDKPYNLYVYKGFGPGPFNNASLDSIQAVLKPLDRKKDNIYFIFNSNSKKIEYSKTYEYYQAFSPTTQTDNGYVQ